MALQINYNDERYSEYFYLHTITTYWLFQAESTVVQKQTTPSHSNLRPALQTTHNKY